MKAKIVAAACVAAGFSLAALAAYELSTNDELRKKIAAEIKDIYAESRKHVDSASEDVMVKTAQLTKNPKVNQDWAARQWDMAI